MLSLTNFYSPSTNLCLETVSICDYFHLLIFVFPSAWKLAALYECVQNNVIKVTVSEIPLKSFRKLSMN